MSGIMQIFGGGQRVNKPGSLSFTSRMQSSVEGPPRTIGAGQNRFAGTLIWYGDYSAIPVTSAEASGGKGGAFSGKDSQGGYKYSASFMVSLGEQIAAVQSITNGTQYDFFYNPPPALVNALLTRGMKITYGNTYGGTFLLGDYAQNPWSYLVSAHPGEALAYRGEALACFANMGLGNSPSLPNFTFEVLWTIGNDMGGLIGPDANPADWVTAFLSNPDWGAGFPAVLIGALTEYRTWARATSMLISPAVTGQTSAQSHLADVMQGTVAELVWSSGKLTVVPYADGDVSGNGYTYEPAVAPIYDLTGNEFLPCEHGPSTDGEITAVKVSRADPMQVPNRISVEYLDRSNLYNPVLIYDQDDALIAAAGRVRPADPRQHHFFCLAAAASQSAALQMRRAKVLQTFYFRLPPQFVLLDLMDIVTLTDPLLQLVRQPVRIKEITRVADGSLEFTAEEFMGTVQPALYPRQEPLGAGRNANEDPGDVLTPIFFEPTDAEANALEVWMAICGADLSIWGGANVWVATDAGGTYQMVGSISGPARMGVLTAALPSVVDAFAPPTVDSVNVLRVDLSMSHGDLQGGSTADMLANNTASYVDGEIVSYQNAALTGSHAYDLSPLVRGAFGSAIGAHAIGSPYVRLDGQVFHYPFTQDRVGTQIYIKLQSFNIYGGGLQSLADIGAFPYTIKGTALSSPLPDISEIRTTYVDKTSAITWDEVADFRPLRYEIRQGESWETGLNLGTVAHPPFVVRGDGTYLVKARSEPLSGLVVYSENALSIPVVGSVIPENIVATYDEWALGWPGTIDGPGAIVGGNFVTTATGVIARYTAPSAHIFDVLYDRPIHLNSSFQIAGAPIGDDILSNPDFLGTADILGSTNTRYVDAWVEVVVQSGVAGDVFSLPDAFSVPDIFGSGGGDIDWIKYAPGSVVGRFVRHRLAIVTYDAGTQATAVAFTNSCDVPTRVDHYSGYALGSGGQTFVFIPDGTATPTPFNGGPGGNTNPLPFVGIFNQQAGDYAVITSLSLSQMTVQVMNAGVGVARTVNITIEGW